MKEENYFLYTISGIACILVVFIHVQIPGIVGKLILPVSRFAVPYFFAISGYYYRHLRGNEKTRLGGGKFLKFSILFLKIWFCYLTLSAITSFINGESFFVWLSNKFTIGNIVSLLIFNHSHLLEINNYTADSLWFLPALAYVYIIMELFGNFVIKHKCILVFILGLCLITGQYLFEKQSMAFLGEQISKPVIVNNWLFDGLLFFLIGNILRDHKEIKLIQNFRNYFLLIIFVLCVLAIVESRLHYYDVYLSSILLTVTVLAYAESFRNRKIGILYYIGKNLSANVYYWHVFNKAVVIVLLGVSFLEEGKWFMPIFVLMSTLVMSYLLYIYRELKNAKKIDL